jgi:hypothetical protein
MAFQQWLPSHIVEHTDHLHAKDQPRSEKVWDTGSKSTNQGFPHLETVMRVHQPGRWQMLLSIAVPRLALAMA